MIPMSSMVVARYLAAVMEDMIQNKEQEIRCPCRKCKQKYLLNPFDGTLKGHLLAYGFMYGYTRWVFPDDDEEVEGARESGHVGPPKILIGLPFMRFLGSYVLFLPKNDPRKILGHLDVV